MLLLLCSLSLAGGWTYDPREDAPVVTSGEVVVDGRRMSARMLFRCHGEEPVVFVFGPSWEGEARLVLVGADGRLARLEQTEVLWDVGQSRLVRASAGFRLGGDAMVDLLAARAARWEFSLDGVEPVTLTMDMANFLGAYNSMPCAR